MGAQVIRFPTHRARRDTEPWATKDDVMAHLQVSGKWIERAYKWGFPVHKDPRSRFVRFKISEVDDWMTSRRAG